MPRTLLALGFALLAFPAAAGTLRCVSVNGNVNCVGDGAQACQTINGHTVCASGDGSVVQSFGNAADAGDLPPDAFDDPGEPDDAAPPPDWWPKSLRTWPAPQRPPRAGGSMAPRPTPKESPR